MTAYTLRLWVARMLHRLAYRIAPPEPDYSRFEWVQLDDTNPVIWQWKQTS